MSSQANHFLLRNMTIVAHLQPQATFMPAASNSFSSQVTNLTIVKSEIENYYFLRSSDTLVAYFVDK